MKFKQRITHKVKSQKSKIKIFSKIQYRQVTGVFEIWSSFASYISYATEVSYSVFITEYEYEYYSAPQNNVILRTQMKMNSWEKLN